MSPRERSILLEVDNRIKYKGMPVWDRFYLQTAFCPITGCWVWSGHVNRWGYGMFSVDGRCRGVHRWIWEVTNGPIPKGMQVDHFRCNNRQCCNPEHLKLASPRENTLRGNTITSANLAKTACPKCGGPYSVAATTGHRFCRPCRYAKAKPWSARAPKN